MAEDTPDLMQHVPYKHYTTPQKGWMQEGERDRLAGLVLSPSGKPSSHRSHFDRKKVPHTTATRITRSKDPRRLNNSAIRKETRGRKKKLSKSALKAAEKLLWTEGAEGRQLSWDNLATEAETNVSGRTLRRHMREKGYRRCVACRRSWIEEGLADKRVIWATKMLAQRPQPPDWRNVRFTDEVHLGYGPQGRIWVTRRPGEKHCPDCVQQVDLPRAEDEKKVHA